jgi:hypothetical protein
LDLGNAVLTLTVDESGLVTGFAKAKEEGAKFESQSKTTKESVAQLSEVFRNIGIAITAALGFSEKLLKAWADSEAAAVRLGASVKIMIGDYSNITQGLIDYAEELQKSSGFTHEMIENQMAEAITLGRTEEQVKSLSLAATELANAGIMPLDQAFRQLDLTYEGNLRQLGRMFPELKNLTTEQLANGDAVKFIENRVNGMNDAMMNTIQGGMRNLKNSFGELSEEMGKVVAVFAGPAMQAFSNLLLKASDFIKGTMDLNTAMKAVHDGTATEAQRVMVMTDALGKANEAFDLTVNRMKTLTGNFGENAEGLVRLRSLLTEQSNTIKTYVDALAEIEKKNNALEVHRRTIEATAAAWKLQEDAMKAAQDRLAEVGRVNATWDDVILSKLRLTHDAMEGVQEITNKTYADMIGLKGPAEKWMSALVDMYPPLKSAVGIVTADIEKLGNTFDETYRKISQTVSTVTGQLSAISSQYFKNQNTALDNWYKKQIASLGDMTNATQAQTDAKAAIDKEYTDKQAEIKKDEWRSNQALAVGNVITSTAEAVVRTLAAYPWPFDLIPAAIVGALGVAQLGLILSSPEPTFAQGGEFTVPPGYPNDSYPIRVESGEHVSVTPAGEASSMTPLVIQIDGTPIYKGLLRATANGIALIDPRGIRR